MTLRAANFAHDRAALLLNGAGGSRDFPIFLPASGANGTGMKGRFVFRLGSFEVVRSVRLYSEDGSIDSAPVAITSGQEATVDIVFAASNVASGSAAQRNFLLLETNRGSTERQFWTRTLPSSGAIYINNQEAQSGRANVFRTDSANPRSTDVTFGVALFPGTSGEFFAGGESPANRYAQTLRPFGGAATAEVRGGWQSESIVAERPAARLRGLYLESMADGDYGLTVILRAMAGSSDFLVVPGKFRVLELP